MKRVLAQSAQLELGESTLPRSQVRQYRQERWAASFAAVFLAFVLLSTSVLRPLEDRLIELRARLLNRAPTGELVIVDIDPKSIAALKVWPWSRRIHADLVSHLHAAGASMIAFDVDFSAKSDGAGDEAFAKAIREAQPVILPVFEQRASEAAQDHALVTNRPATSFDASWIGGVNILPDHDGMVRDFPAATMIGGRIQPSMAVLLAENDRMGDRSFQPDWAIDARRIPHISFIDVIRGSVPRAAIAGKRVIVGGTAIELGDRYTIPRFGTVPGVVVQALAAESLLQRRAISRSGWLATVLGLSLIFLLSGFACARFRRAFAIVVPSTFLGLLAGPVLLQARVPVSIDTAGLLVAALAGASLRIVVEARMHSRLNSLRDAETGLPNSRALEARLEEKPGAAIVVVAASIDRLETIRAALGSAAVAELVNKAAERLRTASGTEIFRVTSDTLAWFSDDSDNAERIVAMTKDLFLEPLDTQCGPVDVRLTFGFTATPTSATGELLEQSLAAINVARTKGESSHWFQGIAADALSDLSIIGKLRSGISNGDVFVAYQPKLDLRSGAVTHAEALVRWRHPIEGLIPPDRFLPLAEETGAVRELTRFVLREVLSQWSQQVGLAGQIGVSVNVSAADIADPGFADEIIAALAQSNMNPARLTLEITESAIIGSHATALKVLQELRRRLVHLSIDDYGTGQSTLSYLKTFPVDELKIDKSFVTSMCSTAGDRIMVRSTIGMAHELGLRVVAEGVEDWGTVKLLEKLDCDYAQGFCIGSAMSFESLCSMAERSNLRPKAA